MELLSLNMNKVSGQKKEKKKLAETTERKKNARENIGLWRITFSHYMRSWIRAPSGNGIGIINRDTQPQKGNRETDDTPNSPHKNTYI